MTRRRFSSMPAGMVIAALAVIALVAFIALFIFSGSSGGSSTDDAVSAGSELVGK